MKWMKNMIKEYKGLPRSIYVLFFASIINYMGCFIGIIITMFMKDRLGFSLNTIGLIVGTNAGLGMLGAVVGGKIIDKVGRKKVLVIFRNLAALAYALCAFVSNPIIITGLLMLASFFGGLSQPVYNTMIADITEGEQRKSAFSLNYMALNIGLSVGPLLGTFLYHNHLKVLFLGDALTTVISVILIGVFVPETKPEQSEIINKGENSFESGEEGSLFKALKARPTLLMFSFIIVIFFVVFSQTNFGMPLQAKSIFGEGKEGLFGILYTINPVMCSLGTVFVMGIFRKFKPSLNIAFGGIFYMIGFGMIFFVHSFWLFAVSTVIWTIGEILISTNTGIYIADHTPITHRGRFNSVFPIIRKIGGMIGPAIGGLYAQHLGLRNLWLFIGALSAVGAIMMFKLYKIDRRVEISANYNGDSPVNNHLRC